LEGNPGHVSSIKHNWYPKFIHNDIKVQWVGTAELVTCPLTDPKYGDLNCSAA
jgi:hypothetical protein